MVFAALTSLQQTPQENDAGALGRAVNVLVAQLGPVDVLVTSAGYSHPGRFTDLETEVFERQMAVDYFGTLYAIRAVVPSMVEQMDNADVYVRAGAGLALDKATLTARALFGDAGESMCRVGQHVHVVGNQDQSHAALALERAEERQGARWRRSRP